MLPANASTSTGAPVSGNSASSTNATSSSPPSSYLEALLGFGQPTTVPAPPSTVATAPPSWLAAPAPTGPLDDVNQVPVLQQVLDLAKEAMKNGNGEQAVADELGQSAGALTTVDPIQQLLEYLGQTGNRDPARAAADQARAGVVNSYPNARGPIPPTPGADAAGAAARARAAASPAGTPGSEQQAAGARARVAAPPAGTPGSEQQAAAARVRAGMLGGQLAGTEEAGAAARARVEAPGMPTQGTFTQGAAARARAAAPQSPTGPGVAAETARAQVLNPPPGPLSQFAGPNAGQPAMASPEDAAMFQRFVSWLRGEEAAGDPLLTQRADLARPPVGVPPVDSLMEQWQRGVQTGETPDVDARVGRAMYGEVADTSPAVLNRQRRAVYGLPPTAVPNNAVLQRQEEAMPAPRSQAGPVAPYTGRGYEQLTTRRRDRNVGGPDDAELRAQLEQTVAEGTVPPGVVGARGPVRIEITPQQAEDARLAQLQLDAMGPQNELWVARRAKYREERDARREATPSDVTYSDEMQSGAPSGPMRQDPETGAQYNLVDPVFDNVIHPNEGTMEAWRRGEWREVLEGTGPPWHTPEENRERRRRFGEDRPGHGNDQPRQGGQPTPEYKPMTWDEYNALTARERAAVDYNTALYKATQFDKHHQDAYEPTDEERSAYRGEVREMFGPGRLGDIYAPATVALLNSLEIDNKGLDLDDFLDLRAGITAKELANLEAPTLPGVVGGGNPDMTPHQMETELMNAEFVESTMDLTRELAEGREFLDNFHNSITNSLNNPQNPLSGIQFGGLTQPVHAIPGFGGAAEDENGDMTMDEAFRIAYGGMTTATPEQIQHDLDKIRARGPEVFQSFLDYVNVQTRTAKRFDLPLGYEPGTDYLGAGELRHAVGFKGRKRNQEEGNG